MTDAPFPSKNKKLDVAWAPISKPQLLYLTCPALIRLFGGARGGGKSEALIGDFISHVNKNGQYARGLLVRKSTKQLADMLNRMQRVFGKLGAVYNASSKTFTFPSGAQLEIAYLKNEEDAENYHGQEYTWIAVDEAGNFKDLSLIWRLLGSLRSTFVPLCQMTLTANPGGPGHGQLKRRFITNKLPNTVYFVARNPDVDDINADDAYVSARTLAELPEHLRAAAITQIYIPATYKDNTKLPKDYIAKLHNSGPSSIVRAWMNGDWDIELKGNIFSEKHFRIYNELPEEPATACIQSWDTAAKKGETNDYSVCTTALLYKDGLYVAYVFREKLTAPELFRKTVELYEDAQRKYAANSHFLLIEDASNGIGVIQRLKEECPSIRVVPVKPKLSKEERAFIAAPVIERGTVLLPIRASWKDEFLTELVSFPDVKHDDMVDSFVQLVNYVKAKYGRYIECLNKKYTTPEASTEAPEQTTTAKPAPKAKRAFSGDLPRRKECHF